MTITGGAISGVDASFSKVKDEGTTETTTHTGTTVTAADTLTMQSGNDTTITGSQVGGKTVKVDVGGNLNISSLQDTETYRGDSSSMGGGISVSMSSGSKKDWLDDSFRKYDSTPYVPGTTGGSAFLGKGSMDSDYASVTQQAGIYAGEGGFTVHVEDNTRLTGSLLDSTASEDKNSLTTGTLTMEDMGNKAEYDVKDIGISYTHYGTDAEKYKHYNESGLVPDLMPGAEDEASSTTHSAIAPGTITTTKEKTDLSQINRDTANALNKLDHIFDKKTIEEKQELAKLFAKNGNELIHKVSEHYGWADGDANKVALHTLIGGLTAQIAGGDFSNGAWAAGVNEQLSKEILKLADGDPAKAQLYSAVVGIAVNSILEEDTETGAAVSQYGMKWNNFAIVWGAKEIASVALAAAGFTISANTIKDAQQNVVAVYNNVSGWVDAAGDVIGNEWQDLVVFAKSKGQLKRMPKRKIDELGGENYTQGLKRKVGKSHSDLYWNPKTGDVYAVPKEKGKGQEPELVDTVDPD